MRTLRFTSFQERIDNTKIFIFCNVVEVFCHQTSILVSVPGSTWVLFEIFYCQVFIECYAIQTFLSYAVISVAVLPLLYNLHGCNN